MRLAALSVDLDEVPCYHAIYGLTEAPADPHAVYDRAVPRYRELFAELGVPCTFFVIGEDLSHEPALTAARGLALAGHELGNHTYSHRYDLTRLAPEEQLREVRQGAEAIARAFGHAPPGFRAPGYTITDGLFEQLEAAGVQYDSSVFPCPLYYSAKAAMIGLLGLRGRRSHSVVDSPRVLAASADPYLPSRAGYHRAARGGDERSVFELPIGVTRGARLPFIGGPLALAGPAGARALATMMVGRPLVNLELHGVDVLGAEEDGLQKLGALQRDLRVPVERKLATLRAVVETLRAHEYRFVTLFEAARLLRR